LADEKVSQQQLQQRQQSKANGLLTLPPVNQELQQRLWDCLAAARQHFLDSALNALENAELTFVKTGEQRRAWNMLKRGLRNDIFDFSRQVELIFELCLLLSERGQTIEIRGDNK